MQSVLLRLAVPTALAASAAAQCSTDELFAADGDTADDFGSSIAVDADRMLVGDWRDADLGVSHGSAYVFERGPAGWAQTAELVPGGSPENVRRFGWDVALQGGRAVVGARNEGLAPDIDMGAAYVFELGPTGWVQTQRLVPAAREPSMFFGCSVALDGDTIAVGAFGTSGPLGDKYGSVHVFDLVGGSWVETQVLGSDDPTDSEFFGYDVDLLGGRLLVGAPEADAAGLYRARLYERVAGVWSFVGSLAPAIQPTISSGFGNALDLEPGRAVVGDYHGDATAPFAGSAHVFEEQIDGTWLETQVLGPPPGGTVGNYGDTVALDGDRLVVGDDDAEDAMGAAWVYALEGGSWVLRSQLSAGDAPFPAHFGTAVEVQGETVYVGGVDCPGAEPYAGAVYAFAPLPGAAHVTANLDALYLWKGGRQVFEVTTCPPLAYGVYVLLGTLSGTAPGFTFDGLHVPIELDAYALTILAGAGDPPLEGAVGLLGPTGDAHPALELPANASPALAGATLHHAAVVLDAFGVRGVSGAVPTALLGGAPARWRVAGTPPFDFPTIQEAIDSPLVRDGDVLLVDGGGAPLLELHKSLDLVSPVGRRFDAGTVRVRDVHRFTIAGMNCTALEVEGVTGRGRLHDVHVGSESFDPWTGAFLTEGRTEIRDCEELVVTDSEFRGDDGCYPDVLGVDAGMRAYDSRLVLANTTAIGGDHVGDDGCGFHPVDGYNAGLALLGGCEAIVVGGTYQAGGGTSVLPGAHGIRVDDSTLVVVGGPSDTIVGGWGFQQAEAIGGSGVFARVSGVTLDPPGLPPFGVAPAVPDPWIAVSGAGAAGSSATVDVHGPAGELAYVTTSAVPALTETSLGTLWLDPLAPQSVIPVVTDGPAAPATVSIPLGATAATAGEGLVFQATFVGSDGFAPTITPPTHAIQRW